MRRVLTKGCGERLHHQDQHGNSQVIVAGEQYVHCLWRSAGEECTMTEDWEKKQKTCFF